jgi:hypothetical protein
VAGFSHFIVLLKNRYLCLWIIRNNFFKKEGNKVIDEEGGI